MNITLPSSALSAALGKLSGIVDRKTTLPILSHVLLQANGESVTITGSDLEKECSITIPATVAGSGAICLEMAKLASIASTPIFKNKDLSIKTNAERATISSGKSKYQVNQLPASDYPIMDQLKKPTIYLTLSTQQLRGMLATVEHAMGERDSRYYLNGALLEISKDTLSAVATDGHRASSVSDAVSTPIDHTQELILPNTSVRQLLTLLKDTADENLLLTAIEHQRVQIEIGSLVFRTKVLDGKFPDWRRAIPQNDHICTIEKAALLATIKAAEILAGRDDLGTGIGVEFQPDNGGQVTIWARSNGEHTELEPVPAEYSGPKIEIGITSSYLADAVSGAPGDRVQIEIQQPGASILVRGIESDNPRFVVSPRRL